MKTTDQVAGEAREKLADRLSDAIGHYGKEITTAWDWNPSAIKDLRVEISYADAKDILAALRAQPERGAEEIERAICRARCLRWELGIGRCVDEATHRSTACQATTEQFILSWIGEAAAAIRALPLHPAKDEGGGR